MKILYVRVPDTLHAAAQQYAKDHALTLTGGVNALIELGLASDLRDLSVKARLERVEVAVGIRPPLPFPFNVISEMTLWDSKAPHSPLRHRKATPRP
jgi:hypothetical protein